MEKAYAAPCQGFGETGDAARLASHFSNLRVQLSLRGIFTMRMFGVVVLLIGLVVVVSFGTTYAADKDNEEAVKKDLKKLEGNWRMVRQDHEGREDNGQSIMKNGVLFDGKDYKFLRDGRATG